MEPMVFTGLAHLNNPSYPHVDIFVLTRVPRTAHYSSSCSSSCSAHLGYHLAVMGKSQIKSQLQFKSFIKIPNPNLKIPNQIKSLPPKSQIKSQIPTSFINTVFTCKQTTAMCSYTVHL